MTSPSHSRRDLLKAAVTSTALSPLSAMNLFGQEPEQKDQESSPAQVVTSKDVFQELSLFADENVQILAKIAAVDALVASGSADQKSIWGETRAAYLELLSAGERDVVRQIRVYYDNPEQGQSPLEKIREQRESLTDFGSEQIEELIEVLAESITGVKKPTPFQSAGQERQRQGASRPLQLGLTQGSPFEEALEKTGFYDTAAEAINEILGNEISAFVEKLKAPGSGGIRDLFKRDPNDWRARLKEKRPLMPALVLPELAFEAIYRSSSQSAAVNQILTEIDNAPEAIQPRNWNETKPKLEKRLAEVDSHLAQGFEKLRDEHQNAKNAPNNQPYRGRPDTTNFDRATALLGTTKLQAKILFSTTEALKQRKKTQ